MLSNDWVVRFQNRFLRLRPTRRPGVAHGTRVRLEQARDGALRVMFTGHEIRFREIAKPWPNEKLASRLDTEFLYQEQVSLGEGYLKQPFTVRDGYLNLPTGPGLGIELDDDAVAEKLEHDYRPAETYDADDGSVVDR